MPVDGIEGLEGIARPLPASPPCQRMASSSVRARPVMQVERVAVDCLRQAKPPEWWRPPFLAAGVTHRLAIGQTFAHVMQQEIGIGPDQLVGQRTKGRIPAAHVFRHMAGGAAEPVKHLLALQHIGKTCLAPGRDGQILRIESEEIQDRVRGLPSCPVVSARHQGVSGRRSGAAGSRPCGWSTSGEEMPMSPARAAAVWSRTVAFCAFQPNRPRAGLPVRVIAHHGGTAGNSVPRCGRPGLDGRGYRRGSIASTSPRPIIGWVMRGDRFVSGASGP